MPDTFVVIDDAGREYTLVSRPIVAKFEPGFRPTRGVIVGYELFTSEPDCEPVRHVGPGEYEVIATGQRLQLPKRVEAYRAVEGKE